MFLILNTERLSDVLNLTTGAYAPLTGFLGPGDFESVVAKMRLSDENNADNCAAIVVKCLFNKERLSDA